MQKKVNHPGFKDKQLMPMKHKFNTIPCIIKYRLNINIASAFLCVCLYPMSRHQHPPSFNPPNSASFNFVPTMPGPGVHPPARPPAPAKEPHGTFGGRASERAAPHFPPSKTRCYTHTDVHSDAYAVRYYARVVRGRRVQPEIILTHRIY